MRLLRSMTAAVSGDRAALAVKVDNTFLYIGMLLLEFLEDFSLCSLGISTQLLNECFYPVKALFRSSKVQQFFYGKDSAP